MAFLELKGIGKIYVSENSIAVGIRGVNLSFELGEFVAITGQSGSGKSTLLNVISGMDSYEEGEMFVNGEQTSHYTQADWEEFREKYISFIFQDYNIIDSFTVLENVELALMNIADAGARRKKALELIDRVGLTPFKSHKGSHLSGGQKQRTVIARALAKESPIILADEPTGNLDAATSMEIVALLKEVSRDKLLITVTHNFEEVEAVATREIRVFDGEIASDITLREHEVIEEVKEYKPVSNAFKEKMSRRLLLGWTLFKSKPRLSAFVIILLLLASACLFVVTSVFWPQMKNIFVNENYIFTNETGRVIVARKDGEALSVSEVEELAKKTGAKSYLAYDALKDIRVKGADWYGTVYVDYGNDGTLSGDTIYSYEANYGNPSIGSYPKNDGEVLLVIPYGYKKNINENVIGKFMITGLMDLKVTGIKYVTDNKSIPVSVVNENTYHCLETALAVKNAPTAVEFVNGTETGRVNLVFDATLPADGLYIVGDYPATAEFSVNYEVADEFKCFKAYALSDLKNYTGELQRFSKCIIANPEYFREIADEYIDKEYVQASLYYGNATAGVNKLSELGYMAVKSNATVKASGSIDAFLLIALAAGALVVYLLTIIFLAFFVGICTNKSIDAFRPDIAIMRSMGLRVDDIKMATNLRMYIAMAFVVIIMPVFFNIVFTIPSINSSFMSMGVWEYLIIILTVSFLTMKITKKQVARLFGQTVKKALKGGEE